MALTAHTYTLGAKSFITKKEDVSADALKAMLLSSYTVGTTQDTAQFVADVTGVGTELVASGYTAGGLALPGVSITNSGHVVTIGCSDVVWANLSGSPAYAVFYDSTPGTAATNPVICYWDFGGAVSPGGQQFTLKIAGGGLVTLTGS